MKKIPFREFQQMGTKLLDDLPIALTRYGKVVAYVRKDKGSGSSFKKTFDETKKIANNWKPAKECKHGIPTALCKDRKCRGT